MTPVAQPQPCIVFTQKFRVGKLKEHDVNCKHEMHRFNVVSSSVGSSSGVGAVLFLLPDIMKTAVANAPCHGRNMRWCADIEGFVVKSIGIHPHWNVFPGNSVSVYLEIRCSRRHMPHETTNPLGKELVKIAGSDGQEVHLLKQGSGILRLKYAPGDTHFKLQRQTGRCACTMHCQNES